MKKILSFTVLTLLLFSSNLFALSLTLNNQPYTGPVEFKLYNWSIARQYQYNQNDNTWYPEGARAGILGGAQPIVNGAAPNGGDGIEDNWNILKITQIVTPEGDLLWSQSAQEELTAFLHDFDDAYINADFANNEINLGMVGGQVDIYLDTTPDFNPNANPYTNSRPPNAGGGDAWGATDGQLFLSMNAVPGVVPSLPSLTRFEDVGGLTSPFSGHGVMYLEVTGGSHAYMFNTNGFLNGTADMHAIYDFEPPQMGNLFDAKSSDPTKGTVVPEPATIFLLGSSLLSMLGIRKIKRN